MSFQCKRWASKELWKICCGENGKCFFSRPINEVKLLEGMWHETAANFLLFQRQAKCWCSSKFQHLTFTVSFYLIFIGFQSENNRQIICWCIEAHKSQSIDESSCSFSKIWNRPCWRHSTVAHPNVMRWLNWWFWFNKDLNILTSFEVVYSIHEDTFGQDWTC